MAIVLALLTVSYRARKAALANPARSLQADSDQIVILFKASDFEPYPVSVFPLSLCRFFIQQVFHRIIDMV